MREVEGPKCERIRLTRTCAQRSKRVYWKETHLMNTEPTMLALPLDLLAAVDKVVQDGCAQSRDEWIENALRRQLAESRRSAVEAEFRYMAGDVDYQRDVHQILEEFAQADWETLHEGPPPGANDGGS